MIKVHKSKYRDSNSLHFLNEDGVTSFQDFDRQVNEMRTTSQSWIEDPFNLPEKMYEIFRDYLKRLSTRKDEIVFIDVGAAEGAYSCSVIEHFKKFNISIYEPDLPRLKVCCENLQTYYKKYQINPHDTQVDIYEHVVSDGKNKTETLRHFTAHATGGHAGSSRMFKAEKLDRFGLILKEKEPHKFWTDLEFEAVKLDDLINSYKDVDLIKIDVEGAEIKVLEGAKKFIDKFNPVIFIEVHCAPENGSITLEQVKEVIGDCKSDYHFTLVDEHARDTLCPYTILDPPYTHRTVFERINFLEYYILQPAGRR